MASPHTSSDPASSAPNDKKIRTADRPRRRLADFSAEERRACANELYKDFFCGTLGNLNVSFGHSSKRLTTDRYVLVPPKSDPCFKVTILEDCSVIRDDSVDGSLWFANSICDRLLTVIVSHEVLASPKDVDARWRVCLWSPFAVQSLIFSPDTHGTVKVRINAHVILSALAQLTTFFIMASSIPFGT